MKLSRIIVLAAAMMALASLGVADEKPWFDMQGCAFCKHLTTDTSLLKNVTWDHYDISNGCVVVTTVKPEAVPAYKTAMAEMQKVGEGMAAGKMDVPMCGHCQAYGALLMAGTRMDYVPSKVADIIVMSSDKPETWTT